MKTRPGCFCDGGRLFRGSGGRRLSRRLECSGEIRRRQVPDDAADVDKPGIDGAGSGHRPAVPRPRILAVVAGLGWYSFLIQDRADLRLSTRRPQSRLSDCAGDGAPDRGCIRDPSASRCGYTARVCGDFFVGARGFVHGFRGFFEPGIAFSADVFAGFGGGNGRVYAGGRAWCAHFHERHCLCCVDVLSGRVPFPVLGSGLSRALGGAGPGVGDGRAESPPGRPLFWPTGSPSGRCPLPRSCW